MLRLNRTVPTICFLAVSAIAAGIFLAPSHKEIALMQMDDFKFNTALKNFNAMHSAGDRSINVLAPLVNLNIYYGDIDKSIALLESYVGEHPNSIEGHKKLAELYKSTQRFAHYCEMLEELQKLAPSTAILRELVTIYNFLGDGKKEMNALMHLVDSKGYRPKAEDYLKLASFYRIDNQPNEAIRTLRDYIDDKDYRVEMAVMHLSIQLYLEAGKEGKALSLSKTYLKKQANEGDAILISSQFEQSRLFDTAYAVLTPFLDNLEHSPDLQLQVVDLMLAQKKDDDVYAMLKAQRAKGLVLSTPLAVALTDLAVTRADYGMLEELISTQKLEQLPEEALLRYANMSFQLRRPDLANIMQNRLSDIYMRNAPALFAVLAVAANDTPQTMEGLSAMPRDTILSPEAKIIIAGLYIAHNQPQKAFALIEDVPVSDILTAFDAAQYAQLYLDVNAGPKAERILAAARPTSLPEIQNSIDQTFILLAAGEGKADIIKQKLQSYAGSDSDFWPDAYDLALRYHHEELALYIAEQLYKAAPTTANRLQLAEALLFNRRYADALGHLRTLVETDVSARAMFLDAITEWALQAGGAQGIPDSQKTALISLVEMSIKNPNMSLDEKRDLAYVLEQIGMLDQSERVLIAIAGSGAYNDPDVQDLLGFWEDHPTPASVEWVKSRARHISATEQVAWLVYLNDNEHPGAVLDVLQGVTNMSRAIADQYLEALILVKDKEKLEYVLEHFIDSETSVDQLRKYSRIAVEEDAQAASERGWRKLYALNSGDDEAAQELGLINFEKDRYEVAEPLLRQYLQHNQADFRVNYAYGEILQQEEETEAQPFFANALRQLSDIKEKDLTTRIDEAYLLYCTDNITKSLALYRRLLNENPDNKEIRAAYVEVLVEIGRFDEASALLK